MKEKLNVNHVKKDFKTNHELRIHMNKIHPGRDGIYCETCRIILKGETEFKKHSELEHSEVVSPHAKKRKHDQDYYESRKDKVNLDDSQGVDKMEVDNTGEKTLEEQEDEKVLMKQEKWFENEVKYQEMRRKISEDIRDEENKRKRQVSIKKKKTSGEKKKQKENKEEFLVEKMKINDMDEKQTTDDGPGYMGWTVNDKEKEKDFDIKGAFEGIQSLYKLYQGMEVKMQGSEKEIKSLKKDLKDLKEEYKQCLDTLAHETYERNKSETENKALRETLEVERKIKSLAECDREENMSIVEGDSQGWTQQRSYSRRKNLVLKCGQCNKIFKSNSDLQEHNTSTHVLRARYACGKCGDIFSTSTEF